MAERTRFDIVIATDPRLDDGGNRSLAEQVRIHAGVGYRTALLSVAADEPLLRGIDPELADLLRIGSLELVRPDHALRCSLLLGRGPRVIQQPQRFRPDVVADHAYLIVDEGPQPDHRVEPHDHPMQGQSADELFGLAWTRVAASSVVAASAAALATTGHTPPIWSEVIDADSWHTDVLNRPRPHGPIGRHAWDHVSRWPADTTALLAAYTDDPRRQVECLGGASVAASLLGGSLPDNWRVFDPDRMRPRTFLQRLAVFVHHHHPDWVDGSGRSVLEALAAGVPCVVPSYLAPVFGDAAWYGEPADAPGQITALLDDPHTWLERREAGLTAAAERFGPQHHLDRVRDLIGPPGRSWAGAAARGDQLAPAAPAVRRIAFLSDNGHGLGHVTRLMAIARRLPADHLPVFLTLSESHAVVRDLGFPVEYFPSARKLRVRRPVWEHLFVERLCTFLDEFEPTALVVDHVNPPTSLPTIRDLYPDLRLVWCRRGLWRAGRNQAALALHSTFDQIIEPLDLASPLDRGETIRYRDVQPVLPITLLDADELLARQPARAELGLPADAPAVLLQLTADRGTELRAMIERARDLVHAGGQAEVFAPLHVLHAHDLDPVDGVRMHPVFPMSRYLHAFDAAIATAGYNTYHELMMAAVPSLFLARDTNSPDDQARRARAARLAGAGLQIEDLFDDRSEAAVARLLHPDQRARMTAAARRFYPGNGAKAAATVAAGPSSQQVRQRGDER